MTPDFDDDFMETGCIGMFPRPVKVQHGSSARQTGNMDTVFAIPAKNSYLHIPQPSPKYTLDDA